MCEICDEYDNSRPDEAAGRAYDWRRDSEWMTTSEIERSIAAAGFSSRGRRDDSRPDRMLGIAIVLVGLIVVCGVRSGEVTTQRNGLTKRPTLAVASRQAGRHPQASNSEGSPATRNSLRRGFFQSRI
jgi:hypothetical protein